MTPIMYTYAGGVEYHQMVTLSRDGPNPVRSSLHGFSSQRSS